MRLSDYIQKEHDRANENKVSYEELVRSVIRANEPFVNGLAEYNYGEICKYIAKKVQTEKHVSDHISIATTVKDATLWYDLKSKASAEQDEKIAQEIGYRSWWNDGCLRGESSAQIARTVVTRDKYIRGTGFTGPGMYPLAAKMVKTILWDTFEKKLNSLLDADGITHEYKVVSKKKSKAKFISFDEECHCWSNLLNSRNLLKFEVVVFFDYLKA